MGENAKVNLDFLCPAGSPPQGGGEAPLESRNHAFGLDPLAVFDVGKKPVHVPSVLALGPTPVATPVNLNDAAADAQHFAGQNVVVFRVVAGVRQKSVDANPPASPAQDRAQQWGVVARTIAHDSVNQQVRCVVASQRQLGPARKKVAFLPYFVGVMRRAVSCFHPCGVDAGFLFRADKSLLLGVVEDCVQQPVEQTFFKRRCCAL